MSVHIGGRGPGHLCRSASRLISPPGFALTAPVISRTSGVTTYPVLIDNARQGDWIDDDKLVTRWSTDPTFATSTEGAPVTLAAATTTITVGISAIVSGTYYIQSAAYRAVRPGTLNWSNIVGVGNTTTPTISSSNSASGYQFVSGTKALTASKSGYWAIVGGAYQAQFAISGNTLAWDAQTGTPAMDVQVQFTDYFGNASTAQTITVTIAANTPSAFSLGSNVTGALPNAAYTGSFTVAGLVGGASVPVTGTNILWRKNSVGSLATTSVSVVNGDIVDWEIDAAATYSTGVTATLTAGVTSASRTITTEADPAGVGVVFETPPAIQDSGFSSPTTFTSIHFGVGLGVVVVFNRIRATTGVTVNGVSATLVEQSNAAGGLIKQATIWRVAIGTAGNYDVVVTSDFGAEKVGIHTATLTNANAVPTATAVKVQGNAVDPQQTSSSLTLPAHGIGIAAIMADAATTSWSGGTEQAASNDGSSLWCSTALMLSSGTPSMNVGGFPNTAMVAAAWGP